MAPGLLDESQQPSGTPVAAAKGVVSTRQQVEEEKGSHDVVLKSFRLLIADLCQQFSMGHPGYVTELSSTATLADEYP